MRHHPGHRRVRAMRGAERVVDVDVGELGERLRKRGIVLFLFRVEAQVLEQDDLGSAMRCGHGGFRRLADAVGRKDDVALQQLPQSIGDRLQAELRRRLALRPPQVRRKNDRRALVERVVNGRQRRGDARVVGDRAVLDRHVEVDADEDALAAEIEVLDRVFRHRRYPEPLERWHRYSFFSRSTQRLE